MNKLYGTGLAIKSLQLSGSGMYAAYIPPKDHLKCLTELIFWGYHGLMFKNELPTWLASIKTLTSLILNIRSENISDQVIEELIKNNVLEKITVASNEVLGKTVKFLSEQKDRYKQKVGLKFRAHEITWSFENKELNVFLKFDARIDCENFEHFQIEIIKISYNQNTASSSLDQWKLLLLDIKASVRIIRIRRPIYAYGMNATNDDDLLFTSIVEKLEKLEVLQLDIFVSNENVPDFVFKLQQNMNTLISISPRTCRMSIVFRSYDKKHVDLHETIENTMSDEWAAQTENEIHFNYIFSNGQVISWTFENKILNISSNCKAQMVPTAFKDFPIEMIKIAFIGEGDYASRTIEDCKELLLGIKDSVKVVKIVGLIRVYDESEEDILCTSTMAHLKKLEDLYFGITVSNDTEPNDKLLSKIRQNTDTLLRISPENCKLTIIFVPSNASNVIIVIAKHTLCGDHWSIFWLKNQNDIKCYVDKSLI